MLRAAPLVRGKVNITVKHAVWDADEGWMRQGNSTRTRPNQSKLRLGSPYSSVSTSTYGEFDCVFDFGLARFSGGVRSTRASSPSSWHSRRRTSATTPWSLSTSTAPVRRPWPGATSPSWTPSQPRFVWLNGGGMCSFSIPSQGDDDVRLDIVSHDCDCTPVSNAEGSVVCSPRHGGSFCGLLAQTPMMLWEMWDGVCVCVCVCVCDAHPTL